MIVVLEPRKPGMQINDPIAVDANGHAIRCRPEAAVGYVSRVLDQGRVEVVLGGERPPRADEVLREIVSR